eukprot:206090-Hanusia_phi.AAC.3
MWRIVIWQLLSSVNDIQRPNTHPFPLPPSPESVHAYPSSLSCLPSLSPISFSSSALPQHFISSHRASQKSQPPVKSSYSTWQHRRFRSIIRSADSAGPGPCTRTRRAIRSGRSDSSDLDESCD